MTVLSLDLGTKRVGVAVSHGILAERMPALDFSQKHFADFLAKLKKIIDEQKIDLIVIGLPLGRNSKETEQGKWTSEQAKRIEEALPTKIEFVEESYSTLEALERLDRKKIKEKGEIDSESAKVILEQFLNGN